VALGPDLPPLYSDDEALAADLLAAGASENDPLWRMPLWPPYDAMLDSRIADLNNVSSGPMAGSVIAALFLRRFVAPERAWAHMDVYGWNPSAKPGRPEGGEVQAARAVHAVLTRRYRG
jgi:leucyl aminopeptidase